MLQERRSLNGTASNLANSLDGRADNICRGSKGIGEDGRSLPRACHMSGLEQELQTNSSRLSVKREGRLLALERLQHLEIDGCTAQVVTDDDSGI